MRKIYYERAFVEQFLRILSIEQKNEKIPFDNEEFAAGVASAKKYYEEHELNKYTDKIGLLFQKQTTDGEYEQFVRIIEEMNGILVELHNPRHVSFSITMDSGYVEYLENNNTTDIPEKELKGIVHAFEEGANLAYATGVS